MPRPRKCRKVCRMPHNAAFIPAVESDKPPVCLTVEEYEAIRLIDRQGFSQEECGQAMQVARTTVQTIYLSARQKLAAALVDGRRLVIGGGDYRLCDGQEAHCRCGGCEKHRQDAAMQHWTRREIMRIAVTYENGQIFQHFGHTEQFKLYMIENGAVASSLVLDTNGSGHGALAGFLQAYHVDGLICGGIGFGARQALAQAGVELYAGVQGDADAAVEALIKGELAFNGGATCDHHHDHDHDHDCGSHGCGEHTCGGHCH